MRDGVIEVLASALVTFQDKSGVYKRSGDWFEMISVKVVKKGRYSVEIGADSLSQGDEIVDRGAALLRVAHLQASGQGGQGHIH